MKCLIFEGLFVKIDVDIDWLERMIVNGAAGYYSPNYSLSHIEFVESALLSKTVSHTTTKTTIHPLK